MPSGILTLLESGISPNVISITHTFIHLKTSGGLALVQCRRGVSGLACVLPKETPVFCALEVNCDIHVHIIVISGEYRHLIN